MKNTLTLFVFGLLCSQCARVEFEQPLPQGGQEVRALPSSLVGIYQDAEDSSSVVKKWQRIEYNPQDEAWEMYLHPYLLAADLANTKEFFVRNDSLFEVACETCKPAFLIFVARKGNHYIAPAKLRYRIEPAKGKFWMYDEGEGRPTQYALVLRQQGEVYFLNLKEEGKKYWQTHTLQQTFQGIRLQYLSAPNGNISDLPFAARVVVGTSAEGNPDTTHVAKPTDLQLAKYLSNTALLNRDELLRIREKE